MFSLIPSDANDPQGLMNVKHQTNKQTQDDIFEAKEFYIQLLFERYKGKLVLRF